MCFFLLLLYKNVFCCCQVAGYGATCDAHHITAPAPDGNGLARAIGAAMKMGDIAPEVRFQTEGIWIRAAGREENFQRRG